MKTVTNPRGCARDAPHLGNLGNPGPTTGKDTSLIFIFVMFSKTPIWYPKMPNVATLIGRTIEIHNALAF